MNPYKSITSFHKTHMDLFYDAFITFFEFDDLNFQ